MTMTVSRRILLQAGAVAALASPTVLRAQTPTLKITTWGGKWGEIMKGDLLPAFEREFKCSVQADQAFPFLPKLQASPRNNPIYDVLHANSNEQWKALEEGLVEPKMDVRNVPNLKDVYPYAISDKMVGVSIFTSAIGLGFRTDKGLARPTSWKDLADPKLAGQRGGYLIPVNSLGQAHLMLLGKIYGRGYDDLDAAYKALEALRPIKLFDFTGQMEKALLSAEVSMGVIHDSGVYRYDGSNEPVDFAIPSEGVPALEQVLAVTPGSRVKELAYAYVDYMLRPDVQKKLAEAVWYSPSNTKVQLDAKYDAKLFNTPAKVAQLIQMDWKWYNARKDDIDTRVQRILRGR
ncbi:ABC transporter substrate-binding protein [Phreatobacter oligotrophus]|jgi:putative spermidine/putrescine transport system substrate-binding protein|uniref:Putative spermidine/putrescine transport system substrate-binding protein n=1 Tax=Phreatobacter oligotrophus TaxID=1122261 RepID=A0A2T4Z6B5_9HYPH|nr:extracellular solute-binding protein [Phreatobacter oligotrophus]PTM57434.1 putative spermidine/putrescine transport system substrate-binding protein [Phreatobacter oligotrophus]